MKSPFSSDPFQTTIETRCGWFSMAEIDLLSFVGTVLMGLQCSHSLGNGFQWSSPRATPFSEHPPSFFRQASLQTFTASIASLRLAPSPCDCSGDQHKKEWTDRKSTRLNSS